MLNKVKSASGGIKKGFTLIELVVVMAIIAVLAVIIIGAIVVARNTATETTNRTNANILRTGLEQYYSRYKMYCGAPGTTVDCTTSYTFATLSGVLNSSGVTVTLNKTSSLPTANYGGVVVTTLDGSTAGSLTDTGAFLAPYASNTTVLAPKYLPTINLP